MKTFWERLRIVLITILITIVIPAGLVFILGDSIKKLSDVAIEVEVATGRLSWLSDYPISREGALTIRENLGILSHTREYMFFDALFTGLVFAIIIGSEYLLILSVKENEG
ncbi:hypothetical protein JW962_00485 [Candidatus Dojkabacteria bacterium]|nr:hypothetical protein [Candidatus Dojkabacteria bacterium]